MVAKLQYEAVTSEIRSVRSDVQLMLERLDEAERSSSALTSASTSSLMAPIWIQQGQTGIWIGPADPAVHPPTAATGASVPQPDPGTGTPAFGTGVRSARVSPAPTPAQPQAPPARSARPAPPGQIVLDPQAPPSAYRVRWGSDSVFQLWTKWTLGLARGPLIEALDRCWGPRWRTSSGEAMFYSRRRKIINEIQQRVEAGTARDKRQAIDQLEQLWGTRSLDWLCKNGLNGR